MTDEITTKIAEFGVLPVLTIDNADSADAIGTGLVQGGLPVAEVTLRTDFAFKALETLAADPASLVGAGTVLSIADARRAVDSGARFIVSPGFQHDVVTWCLENTIPVIPGVATPTEALAVRELGVRTAKFFPASVSGGPAWLAAIAAPIPDMTFIATGGVKDESLADYLNQANVVAVGGSWFMPRSASPSAEQIATDVRAVVTRVREIRAGGNSNG